MSATPSPLGVKFAETFRTDPAGWRLKVSEDSHGQHKWVYLRTAAERKAWPQRVVDKYSMGLPTVSSEHVCDTSKLTTKGLPEQPAPKKPMDAARNGLRFYRELQSEDGHWATEYGGELP
jgi:lanosterol synthase